MRPSDIILGMQAPLTDNVAETAPIPRFSVVIPAYKAAETLASAVESVLAQTCQDFEIVIFDDGSPDETLQVAESLASQDERIHVMTAPNAGCSTARNCAIDKARGEFVCLLDADDAYEPQYLERMKAFIEANPGHDIYSCNGIRVFPTGRRQPIFSGGRFDRESTWTLSEMIDVDRVFGMATVRRDLWERLGGYRTDLRHAEDYDFWLRAFAARASHRYLPAKLGIYHETPSGKSRSRIPHAKAQIRIFEDLAQCEGLTDTERRACAKKIEALRLRIDRVELEQRIQDGEFAGARSAYRRLRPAYLSGPLYWVGFALMMLDPRLYASAYRRRNA